MKKSIISICAVMLLCTLTTFAVTLTNEYVKDSTSTQIASVLVADAGKWVEWNVVKEYKTDDEATKVKVTQAIKEALSRLSLKDVDTVIMLLNNSNFKVTKTSDNKVVSVEYVGSSKISTTSAAALAAPEMKIQQTIPAPSRLSEAAAL